MGKIVKMGVRVNNGIMEDLMQGNVSRLADKIGSGEIGEVSVAAFEADGYCRGLPFSLSKGLMESDFGIGQDAWRLFPSSWVKQAFDRWSRKPVGQATSVGIDLEIGGTGCLVLSLCRGIEFNRLIHLEWYPEISILKLVDLIVDTDTVVNVCAWTVGSILLADSIECRESVTINSVDFFGKTDAKDPDSNLGFADVMSEWYWWLRGCLDPDGDNCLSNNPIALPYDACLEKELADVTFILTEDGNIKVRKTPGTANADAVVLALMGAVRS